MKPGEYPGKMAGRPRVAEPQEVISTRIPVPIYQRLVRAAAAQDMNVSSLVRQLLIIRLPKDES